MSTLVIAEKPDLARAIASAYNSNYKREKTHFDVGNNTLVTWCYGHMLGLKEPKDINPEYKVWNIAHLPYKELLTAEYILNKDSKEQLNAIIKLCQDAGTIVNAGDPDDEGQRLVDEILEYAKIKKPVKRLLINDNNIEVVKKALDNMKDNKEFYSLSQKALARSMADLIFGTNLTVLYSKKYNQSIFIGRVATPILSLVVNRTRANKNHKPVPYYELENIFTFDSNTIKGRIILPEDAPLDEDKRILDKSYLEIIKKNIEGQGADILKVEKKRNLVQPPLPYNLLKLQIDASKLFSLSADETLAITQTLREKHQLITYNRSDCQYLNDEHHADANIILDALKHNFKQYETILDSTDETRKSRAFNTSKVSAHHAIIPTLKKIDVSVLSEDELRIYELIAKSYIAQFLPLRETDQTIIDIKCNDYNFRATGTVEAVAGWKTIISDTEEDEKGEKESPLNAEDIIEGASGKCESVKVLDKKTTAPSLYTEATLLADLTRVAKYIHNPELRKILEDKDKGKEGESGGIGTPATRSSIMKSLFDRDYLKYSKKNIIPSDMGEKVFDILPDDIKFPDLTARWQESLNEIEEGRLTAQKFIENIQKEIQDKIDLVKDDTSLFDDTQEHCECGGVLSRVKGKFGYFWSCSGYPDCTFKYKDVDEKPVLQETPKLSEFKCGKCDKPLIQREYKSNKFWGCSGFPKCKQNYDDQDGKPNLDKKEYSCPDCKKPLVQRNGKNGAFWGCSGYPKCKKTCQDKDGEPVS